MKIFENVIKDEKGKPIAPNCFLGAWYHKQFSSKDLWEGIEGTITLPEVNLRRFKGDKNLDTPSIYMGGHAKYESDVGLSFMNALVLEDGKEVVSKSGTAFRPFWRYITDKYNDIDVGSYDEENGRFYNASNLTPNATTSNCYAHYSAKFSEYYYLPGDKIKIMVTYPKKDFMQLKIELIEVSKLESSIQKRKSNNWKNPESFISPLFSSPEDHETNLKEFKRVNAIDQSGNEGKPTIITDSSVLNAKWESVYLYRNINNELVKVAFNNSRSAAMNCPTIEGFKVEIINEKTGGSTVSIVPEMVKNV